MSVRNNIQTLFIMSSLIMVGLMVNLQAAITVTLKQVALVDANYIKIGDIATVKDDDGTGSGINNIFIGKAPSVAETKTISKWMVRECLLSHGVDSSSLIIIGDNSIKIERVGGNKKFKNYYSSISKQMDSNTKDKSINNLIEKVAKNYIRKDIKATVLDLAQNRLTGLLNSKSVKVKVELLYLERKASKLSGFSKIAIEHSPDSLRSNTLRMTYAVYDNGNNRETSFYANFRVRILRQVVVANGFISRGSLITSEMVKLSFVEIRKGAPVCTSLDDVIGKNARMDIGVATPISGRALIIPKLVKRNQQVQVLARSGSFTIQQFAVALSAGRAGEIIKVRNTRSGKIFPAKIKDDGTLELVMFGLEKRQ